MNNKNSFSTEIKDKLLKLIGKGTDPKVVALKGEWGSGKSTFWKKFIENQYYNNAYVSLYGLKSIEDIENSILLQISELNILDNLVENRFKFLKDINIYGINAKSVLSALKPSDFKELVICLDDFERLSNKITINELFGFISDLKENKHCRVVLILNEEKIKQKKQVEFKEQKEKVIDFEVLFSPDFTFIKEIIKPREIYKKYLYKYIEANKIKNIRTINKMINSLNGFLDEEDIKNLETEILETVFETFFSISFVYHEFGFKDFDMFHTYKKEEWEQQFGNNEYSSEIKEFIRKNKQLREFEYYIKDLKGDILDDIVIDFICHHNMKKNSIQYFISEEKINLEHNNLRSQFKKILEDNLCDFKSNLQQYDDKLFKFLSLHQENILKVQTFDSIKNEINDIKGSSDNDYNTLFINIQKNFLKTYEYKSFKDSFQYHDEKYQQIKRENNSEVIEYLESLKAKDETITSNEIVLLLEQSISRNGLEYEKQEKINDLSLEKIKGFILSDKDFVSLLIQRIDKYGDLKPFIRNVKEVLKELKQDEKYKHKVEYLENRVKG